jgi:hypothetical protein
MFNDDQMIGILLCLPKPEIHISRADHIGIGYRVRLRINFRGSSAFLIRLQRSLEHIGVKSTYKEQEHKSRPRPILRVSGIVNLVKLATFIDVDMPDSKDMWDDFREVLVIVDNGDHHTPDGLERILEIKGVV